MGRWQALRGVESANFEFPLFTKDQQRVEILLNATARYGTEGGREAGKEKSGREGEKLGRTRIAALPCLFREPACLPSALRLPGLLLTASC